MRYDNAFGLLAGVRWSVCVGVRWVQYVVYYVVFTVLYVRCAMFRDMHVVIYIS